MPSLPPVVVLAFANDPERSLVLGDERRAIVAALAGAASAGLCSVETLPDARIEDVVDTFLRPSYRDRIAILHFAGHADHARLLFESTRGQPDTAGAGGLGAFLACQRGLRLVFLNGCATQAIAAALLDAGVPAVVASTEEIYDDEALKLADTFYRSLGAGAGVRRAYEEASGVVRMQRAEGDGWPWTLRTRPGAERFEHWTLAQEAGDPLRALPAVAAGDLPARPYRHLSPFTVRDAEVFFGRGEDLRELYDRVLAPNAAPIILLYGQSGVGKSSLVDAGLLPRLAASHEVLYARRERERGLLGTLAQALAAGGEGAAELAAAWRRLEAASGRPLVLVLDQVEESFGQTGAASEELRALAAALVPLFRDRVARPDGKLLLGFRKEWLAEIDGELEAAGLPHARHPLGRLSERGAVEAIEGPTRGERLRQHYGLTIEDGLAERIAREVLTDEESPAAPVLQILLAEMWDAASKGGGALHFDTPLYERLRREERPLDVFLGQQLASLRAWNAEVVDSGLALDYLHYYTTSLSTSAERATGEEAARYEHRRALIPAMRQQCAARYLLTDAVTSDAAGARRLGHDTLAPLVRKRFEESDAPGQRARRVVESRAPDWTNGDNGAPLDDVDLTIVEQGKDGMRAWTADERRLVEASRSNRAKREAARRRRRRIDGVAVAALALTTILSGAGFWNAAQRQAVAESRELTQRALALDRSRRDVALLLAVAAYDRRPMFEGRRALFSMLADAPYVLSIIPDARWLTAFTPDGNALVEGHNDSVFVWDLASGARRLARDVRRHGHETYNGFEIQLSPDGTRFLGVVATDTAAGTKHVNDDDEVVYNPAVDVGVWNIETGKLDGPPFRIRGDQYDGVHLAPLRQGRPELAFVVDSGRIGVLDVKAGGQLRPFAALRGEVRQVAFSSSGDVVVASTLDSVLAWDVDSGRLLRSVKLDPPGEEDLAVSPRGNVLATGMRRGHAVNLYGLGPTAPNDHRVSGAESDTLDGLTADERFLVHHSLAAGARQGEVVVLKLASGLSVDHLTGPMGGVMHVAVSGRKNRVSARSIAAHVWDLDGNRFVARAWLPVEDPRTSTKLAPDGSYAVRREASKQLSVVRLLRDSVAPPLDVGRPAPSPAFDFSLTRRYFGVKQREGPRGARFDVYESETGKLVRSARLPSDAPDAPLTLSPMGDAVVWEFAYTKAIAIQRLPAPGSAVPPPEVVGDTSGADGTIVSSAAFAPDGALIARQVAGGAIVLWDPNARQVRDSLVGLRSSLLGSPIAFSGDGKVVAAASYGGQILIWRRGSPVPFREIPLSKLDAGLPKLDALALNQDGTLLAILRPGGLVSLIDVDAGAVLGSITTRGTDFHHRMTGVGFSSDERLVIIYRDGVEKIATDPEAWADWACIVAANERTRERWKQDAPDGQPLPGRCERLRTASRVSR